MASYMWSWLVIQGCLCNTKLR